jgi:hypothetical protein
VGLKLPDASSTAVVEDVETEVVDCTNPYAIKLAGKQKTINCRSFIVVVEEGTFEKNLPLTVWEPAPREPSYAIVTELA